MPILMRYSLLRRGLGIQAVYRNSGGGLIVGGLAYAALFALIPTLALVLSGIYLLIDDPQVRQEAVEKGLEEIGRATASTAAAIAPTEVSGGRVDGERS